MSVAAGTVGIGNRKRKLIGGQPASTKLSNYRDRRFKGRPGEWDKLLVTTSTLYVGNLSFYTTEEQIHALFSKCGDLKRIIMGLDKFKKTPCGFCFVEYYTRADAENAVRYINGTNLDERLIRADYDAGFEEGRQYGRGRSGGQVRDEYRQDYDTGRGGYGKLKTQQSPATVAVVTAPPPPSAAPAPPSSQ